MYKKPGENGKVKIATVEEEEEGKQPERTVIVKTTKQKYKKEIPEAKME